MSDTRHFLCPHCGAEMEAEPEALAVEARCPRCEVVVVIPAVDGRMDVIDDAPPEPEAQPPPEDRLDELRVQRIAAARRSLNRSRSHCIIGFLACVVVGVQLAWNLLSDVRGGQWGWASWAYLLLLIACLTGAALLFQRASQLQREIE